MVPLTQRIADIAYRWFRVKGKELVNYKKTREKFEQLDLDDMKQFIQFSTFYHCSLTYISPTYVEVVFGYQIEGKPDYFKKILFEMIFEENDIDYDEIQARLNVLVDKLSFCECCDNDNVALEEYNNLCIRCYIYGTTNDDDCCAICLTNDFGVWVVTDCNHKFHHKCYSKIGYLRSCPLCRNVTADTKTLDY
jgi:hypothetical protein